MRATMLSVCGVTMAGMLVWTLAAGAQQQRKPTPTVGTFWSLEALNAEARRLQASPENMNFQFFAEDAYNTEMRNLKGPQPVLVHGRRVDFMVIRGGGGTFVAGGRVSEATAPGEDGSYRGTALTGGTSRVVKPGDVVFVPAGVPHHFSEIPDFVNFILVRWDVK